MESILKGGIPGEIINRTEGKKILNLKKGEYLFREEEPAEGVYLILSGRVKIVKSEKQPPQMILYLAKPGDVLAIQAVIDVHNHTNSAIALTNTSVCFVPAKEFREVVNNNNEYKLCVMQLLCTNIDLIENKISSQSRRTASERFAGLLLLLAGTYGTTDKHTLKIELCAEDLADLTGTSKGYLGKIMGEFCQKEWITVKGNAIKILDKKSLEKEAGV